MMYYISISNDMTTTTTTMEWNGMEVRYRFASFSGDEVAGHAVDSSVPVMSVTLDHSHVIQVHYTHTIISLHQRTPGAWKADSRLFHRKLTFVSDYVISH